MWNRPNVHKMFINIYRNPKTRNWFRYETSNHHFEFKGFSTWGERERETQSFYADCFYIVNSQPNLRAAPVAHKIVWPRTGLNLNSLVRRQELNSLLFSNLSPRFWCVTSPTSPGPNSYLGFLFWHHWMTHPLCTLVNTCVNVCT